MGLTEKHLFEFDDVSENYEWDLEDSATNHKSIQGGEKITAGDVVSDSYRCSYCGSAIRESWIYCPFCGKAVK